MEWGSAKNFIWLWAVAAAVGIFFLAVARRKAQMARFGDPSLIERLLVSLNRRARLLKRTLLAAALIFMVLALAQPHIRGKETRIERKGVDVMIAIDVSRSMLAKDIAPSRLEKAKLELTGLVDKLKGDRIGIVAFAGEAAIQCPLTLDRGAVKIFLSTVNPNLISYQGTSLAEAIRVATQAFSEKEKDYKALILLTDGEDNEPGALGAAQKAKAEGVRIFTVGIGTLDGSTLPADFGEQGYKKNINGEAVISRLNEALLKDIAHQTGGVYYRASRGELEADSLIGQMSLMKQKAMKGDWVLEYEEYFQPFVLTALLLLFCEIILSERKRS